MFAPIRRRAGSGLSRASSAAVMARVITSAVTPLLSVPSLTPRVLPSSRAVAAACPHSGHFRLSPCMSYQHLGQRSLPRAGSNFHATYSEATAKSARLDAVSVQMVSAREGQDSPLHLLTHWPT